MGGLQQVIMFADGYNFTTVHNQDQIRILDGCDTLGNDQLGGSGDLFDKSLAD